MPDAILIGILNDLSDAPPPLGDVESWLRLVVAEYRAAGRIDRDVAFLHGFGLGLPAGSAAKVERAFEGLAARDVLMIVGPAIGDNALVATPLAERFRVPAINWAGAERARAEFMFHLQVGSHEDESLVIARHLAAAGVKRVGVAYDRSPIGRRHLQFLQAEAEVIGLDVVALAALAPLAEEAGAQVEALMAGRAEAVVYLGLGVAAPAVARALTGRGWAGPRIMNTAGIRGYHGDFARVVEGWMYVDMHADGNAALNGLCARLDVPRAGRLAAAKGYDLGRLVAEGIARAPELTREGMKDGLEQVKWLPAAEGHEGTLLGFGRQDRGALHGRYLVVRQWRDGESVQAG